MDVRCPNGIKFGNLEDGVLEVKCRSNRCGAERGVVVVIHEFSASTGKLLRTRKFRDPSHRKGNDGSH